MKIEGYLADNMVFHTIKQDKYCSVDGKFIIPEPKFIGKLIFIPRDKLTQEDIRKIADNKDKVILELGDE